MTQEGTRVKVDHTHPAPAEPSPATGPSWATAPEQGSASGPAVVASCTDEVRQMLPQAMTVSSRSPSELLAHVRPLLLRPRGRRADGVRAERFTHDESLATVPAGEVAVLTAVHVHE